MKTEELKAAGWDTVFTSLTRGEFYILCEKDGPYFMRRVLKGPGVRVEGPFVKLTDRAIGQDFAALGSLPMPDGQTVREWALTPLNP